MPDTPPLTAEDVRREVMEPWCPDCRMTNIHDCYRTMEPSLFTRIPDCQPEGLRHVDNYDQGSGLGYTGWHRDGQKIDPATAVAIILQQIAQSGHRDMHKHRCWSHERLLTWNDLMATIMSGNLPDAVAARQRLEDLKVSPGG